MQLNSLKDIPSSFRTAKLAIFTSLFITIFSCVCCLAWTYLQTTKFLNSVFVLNLQGESFSVKKATQYDLNKLRAPEMKHHIRMFHDKFWNIDQFNYSRRINASLSLIGNSGKELYQTLKASGHFNKLRYRNLTQHLEVDSILLEYRERPYRAVVFGKLSVFQSGNEFSDYKPFISKFDLNNVARTNDNPHGLLITKYSVQTNYRMD